MKPFLLLFLGIGPVTFTLIRMAQTALAAGIFPLILSQIAAQSRGATALKRALEVEIRRTHLEHLARVAQAAGEEQPELRPAFRMGEAPGRS